MRTCSCSGSGRTLSRWRHFVDTAFSAPLSSDVLPIEEARGGAGMLELYHNDTSACAQKVRVTLAEKGLEWKSIHLDLRKGDQQQPEYLKLNPRGVVPTLVDNGRAVRE